jgi:hypothetical protein
MRVYDLQNRLEQSGHPCGCADDWFGAATGQALANAIVSGVDLGDLTDIRRIVAGMAPRPADVIAYYGPQPSQWFDDPKTRGAVVLRPESSWRKLNIQRYVLATGHAVLLHKRAAGAFLAAFAELSVALRTATDWRPTEVQSFCLRHMLWNPSKPLSTHASGSAIDIDPTKNAYGTMGEIPEWVLKIFEAWGIACGARWKAKSKDPMHFEFVRR